MSFSGFLGITRHLVLMYNEKAEGESEKRKCGRFFRKGHPEKNNKKYQSHHA